MIPNLRFQEFQDDFNSDKLGHLITSFSGGTPSASNKAYYDGDIPFIKSGEINDAKTISSTVRVQGFLARDRMKS